MKDFLKRHSLVIGLILMFLYTWTIDLSNSDILPFSVPFFVTITLGWGFIFASLLMTWLTLGKEEVVQLFKRFLIWRVGWTWWIAALLLEPFCIVTGVYLNAALAQVPPDFSTVMAYQIFGTSASPPLFFLPFFLVDLITNGEEMGWRGYVLPRLQVKYGALAASLILGMIWGFWHLPKYITHFSTITFFWSTLHFLAFAVILTWLYNNTKGSLLIVAVSHAISNTVGVFVPMANTVSSGNMGAYIFYVVLEVLLAAAVTILAGPANLSRTEEKQVQGTTMNNRNHSVALQKVHVLALLTLLLLSMLPVAVVRFIRKRRSRDEGNPASRSAHSADSVIFGISLLNLLFLVGLAVWFRPMHPSEFHSLSLTVEIVMGLGVLAALLTPAALVYTVLAWKDRYWGVVYRLYYTLVTVAAVAFVWFLNYWNLIGWRY